MKNLWNKWTGIALVKRIVVGLILGAILGVAAPRCNQHCHPWRCICRCSESHRTPSGILSGSQFTVQRRKIPWRRYQNSSCPLHVQHCTGSCDCRFRQHDFPCTPDTYQCSRRRQCPTGYCQHHKLKIRYYTFILSC